MASRGILDAAGLEDAGGGVWFAVSSRSPASRSVAQPAATMWARTSREAGGRGMGKARGKEAQVTTLTLVGLHIFPSMSTFVI